MNQNLLYSVCPADRSPFHLSLNASARDLVALVLLFVLGLALALPARAEQSDEEAIAAIRNLFVTTQPGMAIVEIKPSQVEGLFEVLLPNGQSVHVSRDARFLIPGDLHEARPEGIVNLGDVRRNELRREKMLAISEDDMIVYEAKGERKATVTVFTDVDCPYCRKLHAEIEEMNQYGIAVRYLAFPRTGLIDQSTGLPTETTTKMISTWCAEDRKAMLTSAKRGGVVPTIECDSPVEEQYQLGREVGVTGTPALVLEDGTILPGYLPAATLAAYLLGDAGN